MQNFKNNLIIFLDTESEQPIRIGKMQGEEPGSEEELKDMMIMDMATLCEALVVTIKTAHSMGFKNESDSMRDCLEHLQNGFVDPHTTGDLDEGVKDLLNMHKK